MNLLVRIASSSPVITRTRGMVKFVLPL